jgi:hypothetical protein
MIEKMSSNDIVSRESYLKDTILLSRSQSPTVCTQG